MGQAVPALLNSSPGWQELNLASLKAASSLRYLDLSWCQQLEGHGLMEGLGCLQLHGLSLAFCRNLCCLPLPMAGLQELNIAGCLSLDDPSNLCEFSTNSECFTSSRHRWPELQ